MTPSPSGHARPQPGSRADRAGRVFRDFCSASLILLLGVDPAQAIEPVSPAQRATAQAQAGVPLSALAADAPLSHQVAPGDTLWAIAGLFLKSPWRWPELWGMNLAEIANPHLIHPGQVLVLVKTADSAQLRLAQAVTPDDPAKLTLIPGVKLSPKIRIHTTGSSAIAAVPLQLITPFLQEVVVLDQHTLAAAPRIVATQEGRVMISRGETAYARGDLGLDRSFALLRPGKTLRDPSSGELLGQEAGIVGTAELVQAEASAAGLPIPATLRMTSARQEAGVGDRLARLMPRDFSAYVPHQPTVEITGQVVSIYGEALSGGQNQVVSLSRGARDGIERGHVLALWRGGAQAMDRTDGRAQAMQLPDEPSGLLFVFRVFERVSYALILSALDPVRPGDRFTQPSVSP